MHGGFFEEWVVLLTRLPFGSTPAPSSFCLWSEKVFDLANDLIQTNCWEPELLYSLLEYDIPDYIRFVPSLIFGKALPVDEDLGTQPYAKN